MCCHINQKEKFQLHDAKLYRVPEKAERLLTEVNFPNFALLNSYLFFIYWIEQPFPIIMTTKSFNVVRNFLFYE